MLSWNRWLFAIVLVQSIVPNPSRLHAAQHTEPFIQYFDCVRAERTPFLADVDVFIKVYQDPKKQLRPASDYTKGVWIDLVLEDDGAIGGVQIQGHTEVLGISQLQSGIQFGVLRKTFHTIELAPDFDPKSGGKLIMGALRRAPLQGIVNDWLPRSGEYWELDSDLRQAEMKWPREKFPDLGLSGKLARHYNQSPSTAAQGGQSAPLWIQTSFQIRRQNGKWVLLNEKNERVDTVFVEMETAFPIKPVVLGINEIKSVLTTTDKICYLRPEDLYDKTSGSAVHLNMNVQMKNSKIGCHRF